MPGRPDVPCSKCGKLIWRGTGSLAKPVCQPCRRAESKNPNRDCVGGCGQKTANVRTLRCRSCAETLRTSARPRWQRGWRQRNEQLGTSAERGYGPEHQAERAKWATVVKAGRAICQQGLPGNGSSGTCVEASRWIQPGSRWALGHTDDRSGWIGPVHHRCNLIDAASRGGKARAANHGLYRGRQQAPSAPRVPTGW